MEKDLIEENLASIIMTKGESGHSLRTIMDDLSSSLEKLKITGPIVQPNINIRTNTTSGYVKLCSFGGGILLSILVIYLLKKRG